MLNITIHQGNANQNHNTTSSTLLRRVIIKKTRYGKCWKIESAVRKEILPFGTTGMVLEGITLSEVSQTQKDNTAVWYHLYEESKEKREKRSN